MDHSSTIRAFNKTLLGYSFKEANSFSENFAQARFKKKLERPDSTHSNLRKREAWDSFIQRDESLPEVCLPLKEWYIVRDFLHRNLRPCAFRNVEITSGSEFIATRGKNSLEAKLSREAWTTTAENFEQFAKICYNHAGLKKAAKHKYLTLLAKHGFYNPRPGKHPFHFRNGMHWEAERGDRAFVRSLRESGCRNIGFRVFERRLAVICQFEYGSRFSTVPKNNKVDRPINIECFANMLVQRSIGIHLRDELKRLHRIDLPSLASKHRGRIADSSVATIDLKNASDNISLSLCKFLLPGKVYKQLLESRSSLILAPYDIYGKKVPTYYELKKISSMGNGFTFELMSLILNTVCRVLDPNASVFGDDIIIVKDKASRLIELLESVGFEVNKEKSFVEGPFRESCGANYHDCEGYIESFDFTFNNNIHDCVVTYNKVKRLSKFYDSFKALERQLFRCIPIALRGAPDEDLLKLSFLELKDKLDLHQKPTGSNELSEDLLLDGFFRTGCSKHDDSFVPKALKKAVLQQLAQYCIRPETVRFTKGFSPKNKLRTAFITDLTRKRHWAKYLMYLHAGRRAKDLVNGTTEWVDCIYVHTGSGTHRARTLVNIV